MSHHNYQNHGRPFGPSPTGGNFHGGSSYSRQMDLPEHHQTNDFPAEAPAPDPFYHSIPHQRYNHALQNAWVPPAPGHGQPEGQPEDIPPPVRGVAGPLAPGRVQDQHNAGMAYQGIVDFRPQPLGNPAYIFPDGGHVQGIQAQAQPNALVNQGRDHIGHIPQHPVPGPPQAAFLHGIPMPDQPRPEDLWRLASRYWYHPGSQVGMVSVEEGTTGQYKVVITLKTPTGF